MATTAQPIAIPQARRGGSEAVLARPPKSSVMRTRKLISAPTFRPGLVEGVAAAAQLQHGWMRGLVAHRLDERGVAAGDRGAHHLLRRRQLARLDRGRSREQRDAP